METIYYHLDARRLTVYDKASGEGAPGSHSYAWIRKEKPQTQPGKILDFTAYSTAPEPSGRAPDAQATVAAERSAAAPGGKTARRVVRALDLAASLAVVIMAVVVVQAFLHLF